MAAVVRGLLPVPPTQQQTQRTAHTHEPATLSWTAFARVFRIASDQ
jgi:hypothetical protein